MQNGVDKCKDLKNVLWIFRIALANKYPNILLKKHANLQESRRFHTKT